MPVCPTGPDFPRRQQLRLFSFRKKRKSGGAETRTGSAVDEIREATRQGGIAKKRVGHIFRFHVLHGCLAFVPRSVPPTGGSKERGYISITNALDSNAVWHLL